MRPTSLVCPVLLVTLVACADWSVVEEASVARLSAVPEAADGPGGIGVEQSLWAELDNTGPVSAVLAVEGAVQRAADGSELSTELDVRLATTDPTVPARSATVLELVVTPAQAASGGSVVATVSGGAEAWPVELELEWSLEVLADFDGDGADHPEAGGDDCDDRDATVGPGATEVWYDGVDQDCDGNDTDADGDGVPVDDDCDDTDATALPGGTEVWYDGIDQDCDGNDTDADADGFEAAEVGGTDCDDTDPAVRPGVADGGQPLVDDDCDGLTDEEDAVEGMVAITELHRTPSDGAAAGWFELTSLHATELVLSGWTVRTDLAEGDLVVPADSPPLAPDGVLVVCADPSAVPEVPCGAMVEPWPSPVPGADQLELRVGSLPIDAVRWNAAWPGGPGISTSLDVRAYSADDNDDQVAWCAATTAWAGADLGTPGAVNPRCD